MERNANEVAARWLEPCPACCPFLQVAASVPSPGLQEEEPCVVGAVIQAGLSGLRKLLQLLSDEAGLLQGYPQEFLLQGQEHLLTPTMKKLASKSPLSIRWPLGRGRVLR